MKEANIYAANGGAVKEEIVTEDVLKKLPTLPPLDILSVNTRFSVDSSQNGSSFESSENFTGNFLSPQNPSSFELATTHSESVSLTKYDASHLKQTREDNDQYTGKLNKSPSVKSSVSVFNPSKVTPGFRPKPPVIHQPASPLSPTSRTPATPSHSSNARKIHAYRSNIMGSVNENSLSSPNSMKKPLASRNPVKHSSNSPNGSSSTKEVLPPRTESIVSSLESISPVVTTGVQTADLIDFLHKEQSSESKQKLLPNKSTSGEKTSYSANKMKPRKPHYPAHVLQKPPPPIPSRHSSNTYSSESNPDYLQSRYSSSNYTFSQATPTIRTSSNGDTRNTSVNSLMGNRPLHQVPSVTIPTNPFNIDYLDEEKLNECLNVYQLSSIYAWLLKIYFEWFNDYIFYKFDFFELVQLLLEHKLTKSYNQETIDSNVDRIIEELIFQKAVRFEKDIATPSESNTDPVSPTEELTIVAPGVSVSAFSKKTIGAWSDYWQLTAEDLNDINPKEVKRQCFIFDLIILEERSLNLGNAAVEIYGKNFHSSLLPNNLNFHQLAFEIFVPLINVHSNYLLNPLYNKLETKGKFIDSVGKIYLKWVHEATDIYVQYAENMATVNEIINWEKQQPHSKFSAWLAQMDNSPEISRSKIYHDVIFFGGFFKSLQNMPITLSSILKNTDRSLEDYDYLKMAIEEIENLNALVDKTMGACSDRRRIIRLSKQLVISKNILQANLKQSPSTFEASFAKNAYSNSAFASTDDLNLRLNEKSRVLLKEGNLLKKRELRMDSLSVFVLLFDNYLLITESIIQNNEHKYKLIERPIPIEYLSLETKNKELEQRLPEKARPSLQHTTSGTMVYSLQRTMGSSSDSSDVEPNSEDQHQQQNTSRPSLNDIRRANLHAGIFTDSANVNSFQLSFKLRNTATNESYTLIAATHDDYMVWISAIVQALKNHSSDKNSSNVFKLECLNDMFSYHDKAAPSTVPVSAEGSPLDMALKRYYANGVLSTTPGLKADISCFVKFKYETRMFVLCAVSQGIFMAELNNNTLNNHNNWKFVLRLEKIEKLEVSVSMDLLFVLSDKKLVYFSLPSIILSFYNPAKYLHNNQIVSIVISEKVSNFCIAENFENSRQLIYEKRGYVYFTTPEHDRISKIVRFFKFYKAYKLPSASRITTPEREDLKVFTKSFIVSNANKGFLLFNDSFNDEGLQLPLFPKNTHRNEMENVAISLKNEKGSEHLNGEFLSTDVEHALKAQEFITLGVISDITSNKTKPITCFQLKNGDFILIYDEAVVKMNKNGQVVNGQKDVLVLDFYCNDCSFNNEFLILCGENLIQIYDFSSEHINNTFLHKLIPVQIVKGKRIKFLSCQKTDDTVISLSHPWIIGRQLILGFYQ
ncbi:hypothetical protein ACO0QE_001856 [Hanseniaspora vineae]